MREVRIVDGEVVTLPQCAAPSPYGRCLLAPGHEPPHRPLRTSKVWWDEPASSGDATGGEPA